MVRRACQSTDLDKIIFFDDTPCVVNTVARAVVVEIIAFEKDSSA